MDVSTARPQAVAPAPGRRRSRLPMLTAVWAAAHTLFGIWWLVRPDAWPFLPGDSPDAVLFHLDPALGAGLFTGFAAAGLVVALAMRYDRAPQRLRSLLFGAAVVEAVVFVALVPDARALTYLGYLVAIGVPTGLVALAVVGSIRFWSVRILALGLVALAVVAFLTGWADVGIVTTIATGIAGGLVRNGLGPLHVFAILAGGVLWAATAMTYFRRGRGRCGACGRPGAAWTRPEEAARWGRWFTVVALLCPLPYALTRVTWLTPWPLGFDAADLAAEPGIRLFGLFLGVAAIAGAVLTSGLISRWGERWPFWMPRLAGRPIPWPVAVVPATLVTCVLLAASQTFVPMTIEAVVNRDASQLWAIGLFPFPLWGATLGLATLAYYYRRRGRCRVCTAG